eukprot:SAG11_NODE_5140_length_1653_cov_1.241313_3_plen_42_part_00
MVYDVENSEAAALVARHAAEAKEEGSGRVLGVENAKGVSLE